MIFSKLLHSPVRKNLEDVDTEQDPQRRRLSGAVGTEIAEHFAGLDGKAHATQRADSAELLFQIADVESIQAVTPPKDSGTLLQKGNGQSNILLVCYHKFGMKHLQRYYITKSILHTEFLPRI